MKKRFKKYPYLTVIGVLGILALALTVSAYVGGSPKVVVEGDYIEAPSPDEALGGSAGPDHFVRQVFHNGFQHGGEVLTTSTQSTVTLAESDLDGDVVQVDVTPTVAAGTTITTMTSSSLVNLVGNETGDSRTYLFYKASSTGVATGPTVTLSPGTGVDMLSASSTAGNVAGTSTLLKATFVRKSTSDFLLIVEKLLNLTN